MHFKNNKGEFLITPMTAELKKLKTKQNCVLCNTSDYELESFVLLCGDYVHTECYKIFLRNKSELMCPVHGFIAKNKQYKYKCTICNKYGHSACACRNIFPEKEMFCANNIKFRNNIHFRYARLFNQLKWNFYYNPYDSFQFVLDLNNSNIQIPLMVCETDKWTTIDKLGKCLRKYVTDPPFLIVGNGLFEYQEISSNLDLELKEKYESNSWTLGYIDELNIFGSFCHKTVDSFGKSCIRTDPVVLYERDEYNAKIEKYSLAWINPTYDWAMDLIECTDNGKNYDFEFKPPALYALSSDYDMIESATKIVNQLNKSI